MTQIKSQKIAGSVNFSFKKSRDGKVVDSFEIAAGINREEERNAIAVEKIGVVLDPPKCGDEGGCGCPRVTFNHDVQFAD